MAKTTMIRVNESKKFYEFVDELFGRTYYRDGDEIKFINNEKVNFYTKKEYKAALKAIGKRRMEEELKNTKDYSLCQE